MDKTFIQDKSVSELIAFTKGILVDIERDYYSGDNQGAIRTFNQMLAPIAKELKERLKKTKV